MLQLLGQASALKPQRSPPPSFGISSQAIQKREGDVGGVRGAQSVDAKPLDGEADSVKRRWGKRKAAASAVLKVLKVAEELSSTEPHLQLAIKALTKVVETYKVCLSEVFCIP